MDSNHVTKVAIIYDSFKIEDRSFEGVVYQMSRLDWELPTSNLDFKRNVGQRMVVMGQPIIFWNARSFIYALHSAGIIDVVFEEYAEEVKL